MSDLSQRLLDLTQRLASAHRLDEALDLCLGTALSIAEMDCGGIYLVDPETGAMDLARHVGLTAEFVRDTSHYDGGSERAAFARQGKPFYGEHGTLSPSGRVKGEGLRALAVVPVPHQGEIIACLNLASHTREEVGIEARTAVEAVASQIGGLLARVRAEEALRQSEERYRLLVENAPLGILSVHRDGTITDMNPKIREIIGAPPDLTTSAVNAFSFHALVSAGVSADIVRCMENDRVVVAERRYCSGYGNEVDVRYHLAPLRDGRGAVRGVLAVVEDITEAARLRTEQARLEEQLAHAQKMEAIGNLAGGMAHDMNNVLSAVMGLSSMLLEDLEPGDSRARYGHEILAAARRGSALTRNLMSFAAKSEVHREEMSLNETVEEIEQLLCRTMPKKIDFRTDLGIELPAIEGDPGRIGQLLMNLCLNAVDAMGETGTLTIATSRFTLAEPGFGSDPNLPPGEYVLLDVLDTGEGMDRETLRRVFEPFFTTKECGRGTGLGLAMVYGTVVSHGGGVAIESAPGAGTRVRVILPAFLPRPRDPDGKAASQGAIKRGTGTVLVVDDEEMVRTTLEYMLEELGYEVLLACDGQGGIELFRRHKGGVDVVLLDMAMPVMDGAECFAEIRKLDPDAAVLLMTGYASSSKVEGFLERGGRGVLSKPFDLRSLAVALADAADHQFSASTSK